MAHQFSVVMDIHGLVLPLNSISNWRTVPPLFAWEDTNKQETLRWGRENMDIKVNTMGLYVLEAAVAYAHNKVLHLVSNPNIQCKDLKAAIRNARMINKCFPHLELVQTATTQSMIQDKLTRLIGPGTIILYRSGLWETDIGQLCNATKAINLIFIGIEKPLQNELEENLGCKVHTTDFRFCSAAKVVFYKKAVRHYCCRHRITIMDLSEKFNSNLFKNFIKMVTRKNQNGD